MRRVFVGIFPPRELSLEIHELSAPALLAAGFRAVPAGEIHLTLRFLGETDEARIEDLRGSLRRALAGETAPRLAVRATGAFPDVRRPRVLWAGVEAEGAGDPGLERLLASVHAGEPVADDVRPHLTLARAPRGVARPAPESFLALSLDLPWHPTEVRLVESRPGAGGAARFPVIEVFALSRNPV